LTKPPGAACPGSQFAKLDQQTSLIYSIGIVHAEQMHRRTSHIRPALNARAFVAEVLIPSIQPGMEQSRQTTRRRIQRGNIRTFHQITPRTSQGQVVLRVRSTVLNGDHVLDMKRRQHLVLLTQPAVLAAVPGAVPD